MFFGFDPFAMIGMNQPRQPNQNQNRQNQIPEENIFGTFANFLNNGFMHPVAQNHRNQNHRNQNN